MIDANFLKSQRVQLAELLELASEDPILEPQLRARLRETEEKLEHLRAETGDLFPPSAPTLPRSAFFLTGESARDRVGISSRLAGEALLSYERTFAEQAIHEEATKARAEGRGRRPNGATRPRLLLTGTPRGSFGFEFSPDPDAGTRDVEVQARSLRVIARSINEMARQALDESASIDFGELATRTVYPLKQFLRVLDRFRVSLRLAFADGENFAVSKESIANLVARLEHDVTIEQVDIYGTFRGALLDSEIFEFRVDGTDEVISGRVSEDLGEEDLLKFQQRTTEHGQVRVLRTTVKKSDRTHERTYLLLRARGDGDPQFETVDDQLAGDAERLRELA